LFGISRVGRRSLITVANSTFPLGGRQVRRTGYGAMQLAGPNVFGAPDDPVAAVGVLRAAVAAGVDHIDTAQYYGPDVVNELIRDALHPYPPELAIVSKVAARRDGAGAVLPYDDPDQLRARSGGQPTRIGGLFVEATLALTHPMPE
jgi:aryl-alcohol dehydrogenase-like predicted oxidoreductase